MDRIPAGQSQRLLAVLLLVALAACRPTSETRLEAPPGGAQAETVTAPASARATLPPEACTREGAWAFFEEFVRRPEVRATYSRIDLGAGAQPGADDFRIALVDNRWVYADPTLPEARFPRVRLTSRRDGDLFRIEYVAAEFGPDDQVLRPLGPAGRYLFEFRDGCWALARAEP